MSYRLKEDNLIEGTSPVSSTGSSSPGWESISSSSSNSSRSSNDHGRHHRYRKKRSYERSKERSRSRTRSRSRSRSPVRRYSENSRKRDDALSEKECSRGNWDYSSENRNNSSSNHSNGKESEQTTGGNFNPSAKISLNVFEGKIPEAPPPPTNLKTLIHFGKPGSSAKPGIQMKLMAPKTKTETKPKITVASAFNIDSDDETEEMPAECRMRMRNIGRDTPTSSGPNSFGKTKKGFVDTHKVFERSLREACADVD
ncbi:PEST proteolytic signal-containing nuclear protein-like [Condylostylus longicornis]|uniref:PEST proteolytic signal-containing nuclear protein-like n=1 Tax=Condylostylus longicornis TaxID=2530218 RepID=UPI00244DBE4E|nr:PEST proteolytic signal-containing nuclear protein-like [Condylostylus longicornis]